MNYSNSVGSVRSAMAVSAALQITWYFRAAWKGKKHMIVPPDLLQFARRFSDDAFRLKGNRASFVGLLSPNLRDQFRRMYERCKERRLFPELLSYINESSSVEQAKADRRSVFLLMLLFDELSEMHPDEFDSPFVAYAPKDEVLDWAIVPSDLRYLICPAQTLGRLQFDDRIAAYYASSDDADRQTICHYGKLIDRDAERLEAFFQLYPIVSHKESRLIYFFTYLVSMRTVFSNP